MQSKSWLRFTRCPQIPLRPPFALLLAVSASAMLLACDAPAAAPAPAATSVASSAAPASNSQPAATATNPPAVTAKAPIPTATPTMAALTAEQLMAETYRATNAAKTVKIDMAMEQQMSLTGGPQPVAISMSMEGSGAANMANKEMQMNTTMNVDAPEQGKQAIRMDVYMVGGYMYIKMSIPGEGEQWMKTKFTEELWQDQLRIDQQLALMTSAGQVRIAGTETIRGAPAHVVEIVPDMQQLFELMGGGQTPGLESIDPSQFGAIGGLFRDAAVKYWISRDRNLLLKVEMRMAGEVAAPSADSSATPFNKMTMDINMRADYTYDQPVSIMLPDDAQGAKEMQGTR